jgi:hypothetical protein
MIEEYLMFHPTFETLLWEFGRIRRDVMQTSCKMRKIREKSKEREM